MTEAQSIDLRLPDDQGWSEVRKSLKLDKAAMAALKRTLEPARFGRTMDLRVSGSSDAVDSPATQRERGIR